MAMDTAFSDEPDEHDSGYQSSQYGGYLPSGHVQGSFPVREDTLQTKVLDLDLKTPDAKVPRDERLIRLTGAHPFNSEAPLSVLYDAGFLTPAELHYVRNHGAAPIVEDDKCMEWTIKIDGLVKNPITLTVRQLIEDFDQYTTPVTLVCAGNRRKEQNVVRKGSGFNWGAAGVSTSIWTGPMLKDVLEKAQPLRNARYVCMVGGDTPANGAYGTSIKLSWAMDYERNILLAHKQNGVSLQPDHGRPIRVLIPGVIGGRSVKWLTHLTLSDVPSENYYHIFDNRVLPTVVTPDMAKTQRKWWEDERYAIYDLNVQSAIVYPQHSERMQIIPGQEKDTYNIRGYAYSGGGVRVGRVEVSIDKGKTWHLTRIRYPEDDYREAGVTELFGGTLSVKDRSTSFCWCFWNIDMPMKDLFESEDIVVRAMDESMNIQPRDMYWNVMSMLNNWWYRIAIIKEDEGIRFEHPAPVGPQEFPGWMERVKKQGGNILGANWGERTAGTSEELVVETVSPAVSMVNEEMLKVKITAEELEAHSNEENPWFVVEGQVYDGTAFLEDHPGGPDSITMVAGQDATEDFMAIHSETAKEMLQKYHVGYLDSTVTSATTADTDEGPTATFLNPKKWKKTVLLDRKDLSRDTRLFTFKLEHDNQTSGLPVGGHLFIRTKDKDGTQIVRAYTPVSCHRTKGRLELLIKVYFASNEMPGGKMTTVMESMQIGQELEIKGPIGSFNYLGKGLCLHRGVEKRVKKMFMIAGGSGITPPYQVLKEIIYDKDDPTIVELLDGNKEEEDILLREELDALCEANNHKFSTKYWLSARPTPDNWLHNVGRINKEVMDKFIIPGEGHMLLVCGPDGMMNAVKEWVESSEFDSNNVVYF